MVTFDNSLTMAVRAVRKILPDIPGDDLRFIRDMNGQLHVLVPDSVTADRLKLLRRELAQNLVQYSPGADSTAFQVDEAIAGEQLLKEPWLFEWVDGFPVYLIERRAIGQDWIVTPRSDTPHPPRFVFYSLKGGVGRSTALLLWGQYLAAQNRTVLLVDLDIEAPGLGTQLLTPEQRPEFGVLDWLVEDLAGRSTYDISGDMTAQSTVSRASGVIVAPALGRCAEHHPSNIIAKLARAYLEGSSDSLPMEGFALRLRRMFQSLECQVKPDVVLIDSRAGLHETAATTLLHLDAEVLLFAEDLPVTWQGYGYLFSHLKHLVQSALLQQQPIFWRERFKMVNAKAVGTAQAEARYVAGSYNLWVNNLYDEIAPGEELTMERFSFDEHDVGAPHWPYTILQSEHFERFNPLQDLSSTGEQAVEMVFSSLFTGLTSQLELTDNDAY